MNEEVLSSEYSYEGRKLNLNKYFISKKKVKKAISVFKSRTYEEEEEFSKRLELE